MSKLILLLSLCCLAFCAEDEVRAAISEDSGTYTVVLFGGQYGKEGKRVDSRKCFVLGPVVWSANGRIMTWHFQPRLNAYAFLVYDLDQDVLRQENVDARADAYAVCNNGDVIFASRRKDDEGGTCATLCRLRKGVAGMGLGGNAAEIVRCRQGESIGNMSLTRQEDKLAVFLRSIERPNDEGKWIIGYVDLADKRIQYVAGPSVNKQAVSGFVSWVDKSVSLVFRGKLASGNSGFFEITLPSGEAREVQGDRIILDKESSSGSCHVSQ